MVRVGLRDIAEMITIDATQLCLDRRLDSLVSNLLRQCQRLFKIRQSVSTFIQLQMRQSSGMESQCLAVGVACCLEQRYGFVVLGDRLTLGGRGWLWAQFLSLVKRALTGNMLFVGRGRLAHCHDLDLIMGATGSWVRRSYLDAILAGRFGDQQRRLRPKTIVWTVADADR